MKVCSGDTIDHLVRNALPGLPMNYVQQPPGAIPVKLNYQYFSLSQGGPCWEAIQRARNLAAYVPSRTAQSAVGVDHFVAAGILRAGYFLDQKNDQAPRQKRQQTIITTRIVLVEMPPFGFGTARPVSGGVCRCGACILGACTPAGVTCACGPRSCPPCSDGPVA